jgi:hypothetical protein
MFIDCDKVEQQNKLWLTSYSTIILIIILGVLPVF